jgi:hypothetical protein
MFLVTNRSTFWVTHPTKKFPTYVALLTSILETKPSSFEEAAAEQVWHVAMTEEYNSNLKNDVWEIVARPIGKSVVDYRWIYKVKHTADGRSKSTRLGLLPKDSLRKRELTMMRLLP